VWRGNHRQHQGSRHPYKERRALHERDLAADLDEIATFSVILEGGRGRVVAFRNPARPLTRSQHLAKLHRCLDFSATEVPANTAERLMDAVDRLEELEDVRPLSRLAANLG
jgi:hypothetical protein